MQPSEVMLLISPQDRSDSNVGSVPEKVGQDRVNRPVFRKLKMGGLALLALAIFEAVGCGDAVSKPPSVDITPDGCRALCAPGHVYSWTINSCVCHAPCGDGEPAEGGAP